MELHLCSPVGAKAISYKWPLTSIKSKNKKCETLDIIQTMKWVCEDVPELKPPLEKNILCDYDENNYESMKNLCQRFNKMICTLVNLEEGTSLRANRHKKYPSRGLLEHILEQAYIRAVDNPKALNKYKKFTSEVYGETSYEFICKMIEQIEIKPDDVFVDLGSGVGQVVLQMAAATPCKMCIGIERASIPNKYAEKLQKYFREWMQWYGKKFGEYKLIKGDFLANTYRETILGSSIVFVNNISFEPHVDNRLKEIFTGLKDGTQIISTNSFCPPNSRITVRNETHISSILKVSQMPTLPDSVSWTSKPIPFYLHIIDRQNLKDYFKRLTIEDTANNSDALISSNLMETTSNCEYTDLEDMILPRPKEQMKVARKRKTVAKIDENRKLPVETHEALDKLLDGFRSQYIQLLETMKNNEYKAQIEYELTQEKERNILLQSRAEKLEKEIKTLIDCNAALINELDLNVTSSHNENLKDKANKLEAQVTLLEEENARFMDKRHIEVVKKYHKTEVSKEANERGNSYTLLNKNKLENLVSQSISMKANENRMKKKTSHITIIEQKKPKFNEYKLQKNFENFNTETNIPENKNIYLKKATPHQQLVTPSSNTAVAKPVKQCFSFFKTQKRQSSEKYLKSNKVVLYHNQVEEISNVNHNHKVIKININAINQVSIVNNKYVLPNDNKQEYLQATVTKHGGKQSGNLEVFSLKGQHLSKTAAQQPIQNQHHEDKNTYSTTINAQDMNKTNSIQKKKIRKRKNEASEGSEK